MAHYSPEEAFESLKKRTARTIQNYFPIEGKQHTLVAKKVWVDDDKDIDDIREQKDARIKGRSWTVPIRAELELKDKSTGKVVDKQVVNVAQLPKITRRYSYIVNGSEWQVNNLFRMKSGVYTRIRRNGELTSQWNLAKGKAFDMDFSPKTQKMTLRYGEAQIPLYPILKTMGVDDDSIERTWGKDILSANKSTNAENALRKFYRAVRGSNPETVEEAKKLVIGEFDKTVLRPDSTQLTLGKPYDKVNGASLLAGSKKILQVSQQKVEPDDRDSLSFKDLYSAEDLINERLEKWQVEKGVKRKIGNTLDKHDRVRDIINPDVFGKPLRKFFVSSVLSERPTQTNPISFISGNRRTTLFAPGEGGIKSTHEVSLEAQSINPSHLGFLDPIHTPESDRIGVTLQLASHVVKDGQDLKIPVFNVKTGKREFINPYQALKSNLAFPDQYEWKAGKPVPVKDSVKVSDSEGTVTVLKPKDVDYVLASSKGMFDLSANIIPFLQNNQGNRTMVASRQLEQAVSLKDREEPLVQTRSDSPSRTFEQGLGAFVSHVSPINGVVESIKKDAIIVKAKDGSKKEVQLYDDYPLNDDKSVLSSTPLVKVGDNVSSGQVVADINFTKNGTLALGTNLRVAYMPWKGLNFEDGVVVSETAAKKLTCFDARTEILSNRGWLTRDQLRKSDLVASLQDGKLSYQSIIEFHDGLSDTMAMASSRQFDICVTPTHKLYVSPSKKKVFEKVEASLLLNKRVRLLRTAENAGPDQDVFRLPSIRKCNPHGPEYNSREISPLSINMDDWCLLFGLYIAEGHCDYKGGGNEKSPKVSIRQFKPRVKKVLKELSSRLGFGTLASCDRWLWSSKQAASYLSQFGKAVDKYLPEWVWSLSQRQSRILLEGLLLGDGGLSMQKKGSYFTSSVRLRDDVQRLALHCGYSANWSIHCKAGYSSTKSTGEVVTATVDSYRVSILGEEHSPHLNASDFSKLKLTKLKEPIKVWCVSVPSGVVYVRRNGKPRWCGNSEHLFREKVTAEKSIQLDKKKFMSYMAGKVTKEQSDKLDEDAIIREGQTVNKDDILFGVLKEENVTPDEQKLGLFSKGLIRPWKPREIRWTKDVPGTVTRVAKHGKNTTVYVRAEVPADVGDKIVGRHGNKGVVTRVIPDSEMPKTKEGKPVEVLLNQTGVPTRINLGQVLETAAAKLAEKKGKPYVVNNFDPKITDYTRHLRDELKKNGVSDTEDLYDPETGRKFPDVLTGPQYILKLHHTADKGLSVRSRDAYDSNLLPSGGGPKGGQTMDAMGLYALLAHNARENIREMQTLKSDFNDEFWTQLQAGDSVPTPKVPFVFKKFEGYLKGMGLDISKEGNNLILQPLTDKKVLEMSNGALADAGRALWAKDAREEVGGIFDPKVTGGVRGTKWSHVPLPERMPNPVFEGPISSLLGLNQNSFNRIVTGGERLNGMTGPQAIVAAVKALDLKKMKKDIEDRLPTLRASKLNDANKKLKYLRALDRAGLSPSEAYTMKHLPVLPPVFRPIIVMDNGVIRYDDVNRLYNHIGHVNSKLKGFDSALPPEEKVELQSALYDGLKAVMLTGGVHQGKHRNAIMQTISGSGEKGGQPKEGFFQDKIIGRRQDLSMRGVITPEPSLSLDEVGLPRKAAAELYKPFVIRRLVQLGHKPLDAQDMVKKNHPAAADALQVVVDERPIIIKRDPVLHKFGVQAFRPRLIEGKAVQVHPLVTSGFNADFDGDKMSAFVPVSQKAVKEAIKMLPSFNLFSPTTGYLMSKPTQESMMGLYKLTEVEDRDPVRFSSVADAARAVKEGRIRLTDPIKLNELDGDPFGALFKKAAGPVKTTVGRVMLYHSLPTDLRDSRILNDTSFMLDKKTLNSLLTEVAKKSPKDFGVVADRLKDIGNEYATGMSIGLDDFLSDREYRDEVLKDAAGKEAKIRSKTYGPIRRKEEIVKLYASAADKIHGVAKKRADRSKNRMYDWVKSGARGSWSQFKQMTVAPMLVADSRGEPVPIPIPKSYSEGLDIGSYFASMHGARMGTIGRVQGTQAPGKMSKHLVNTAMNQLIVDDDCGTTKGVVLPVDNNDVLDRFTVKDIDLGVKAGIDKGKVPAGTLVTPDLLSRLRNNKITKLEVRSPLKCAHGKGLCSKCYGLNEEGKLHSPGSNVGVIAAQALGEPATQLAMNCLAEDSEVRIKTTDGAVSILTLKSLWDQVYSDVSVDRGMETKVTERLKVWDGYEYTAVYTIQRHEPCDTMYEMRTESGSYLIAQGNHATLARTGSGKCGFCGCAEPVRDVRGYRNSTKYDLVLVSCAGCLRTTLISKEAYKEQQEAAFHTRAINGRYVGITREWSSSKSPGVFEKVTSLFKKAWSFLCRYAGPELYPDLYYSKVVSVREVKYSGWTYDLSTASRAFSANKIRTHNSFHTGGIVGAKGTSATSLFNRLEQLLNVPKKLPGAATLADTEGSVSKIEKDPAGGWRVMVSPNKASSLESAVPHYVPATRSISVKKGQEVKAGDALSDGPKNPRDMLARTNINTVQQYLTDEIWNAYKDEGPVRRRNVETFVRAMTNLSEVVDPGDHDTLLRGDHAATSEIAAFNRNLKPGQKQVTYKPVLQGVNMLPLELQTDWIARLQSRSLKSTILDAAAKGWKSVLHGTHPIPGMAVGKEFGQPPSDTPWAY